MNKKILVTGGAGYIGSHTVVELVQAGYKPVIVDNFSNTKPWMVQRLIELVNTDLRVYEGDCVDVDFLKSVFDKEKEIHGVIHFAALKAVGESVAEPLLYYRNNVCGMISVLETMRMFEVKNLIFSSSATVYGVPDKCPITEDQPRKSPSSPYGATKVMCEDIIKDSTRGGCIKAVSLRYFNPIGAHDSGNIGELPVGVPNNLLPYITQAVAKKIPPLKIFGTDYNTKDGSCVRDFIHVVDLAKAHVSTLDYLIKSKENYDIFNVGTGKGTSVLELIDIFEKVNNVVIPREVTARREGDIRECYADAQKIKSKIGWESCKSIEQALEDAWRWQAKLTEIGKS